MKNEQKYVSATDMNKFIYCNYSYYYKEVYGSTELNKLKKEFNKQNGYKSDGRKENFDRGNKFHKFYYYRNKLIAYLQLLFTILFSILIILIARYLLG